MYFTFFYILRKKTFKIRQRISNPENYKRMETISFGEDPLFIRPGHI